jgi:hypothetical protein
MSYYPQNIAKIEIVSRPQHGIAGRSGPYGVAYKPNAGFHGTDAFAYDVISNSNYREGAGLVAHINVDLIIE